jgi:hypothetical protein
MRMSTERSSLVDGAETESLLEETMPDVSERPLVSQRDRRLESAFLLRRVCEPSAGGRAFISQGFPRVCGPGRAARSQPRPHPFPLSKLRFSDQHSAPAVVWGRQVPIPYPPPECRASIRAACNTRTAYIPSIRRAPSK